VFGRASNLADRAKDMTDRGARDEALKKAANEIMPLFTRCARCNKWADETCFNTARGLCVSCAPNLAAEMEAERASVELSQMRQTMAGETVFSGDTSARATVCKTCGNIDTQNPCTVCTDPRRDGSIIVVVADVADLWALERAHVTSGRYHVLGATLSPLDGVGPQDLTIDALVKRAHDPQVTEIILALNATVDGQTTAHYITDLLQEANVKVTRLAHGVPVGGELDYLDEGTLSAAMRQRTLF